MIEKSYYIVYNMKGTVTGTIKGTVTGTIKGKRTNKPRHNKTVKTRNNKIDIIYWINMEKSRTRRTHMMTVLKDDTFTPLHILNAQERPKVVQGGCDFVAFYPF
jgi:hypothetical protein